MTEIIIVIEKWTKLGTIRKVPNSFRPCFTCFMSVKQPQPIQTLCEGEGYLMNCFSDLNFFLRIDNVFFGRTDSNTCAHLVSSMLCDIIVQIYSSS